MASPTQPSTNMGQPQMYGGMQPQMYGGMQPQPGASGWFPPSNPYQPGGSNAHQQPPQQAAVMPEGWGQNWQGAGIMGWPDQGGNGFSPFPQQPQQPQNPQGPPPGGYGAGLQQGTLAGVKAHMQAGNTGRAKQAYEAGGGTWSTGAHNRFKDLYGG